jgi:NosR/NirI family transcriptional regulator, nitrous oxide reductase regulator
VKRFGAFALIVTTIGATVVIAQRIITNPKPDAHLKMLFPSAAAFSPLAGDPLHFTAYGADPRTTPSTPPIGYAFWTTDIVPNEHGYHGPIHLLVGLDLKGVITGAIVDYDAEPYGYFSVEPPKFGAQFKGKTIHDPFIVGRDVDAVSRASISINSATRAVRDSARIVAQKFLPEAPK